MKVAVVGCLHGSLSDLYAALPVDVELVLCCGDFQALRNGLDLDNLACPQQYRQMGSFHEYYARPRGVPLTIVIGGNHEASNYMTELFYGGWLADNIYYLGRAGSVIVNGLRITGASGIYKEDSFDLGHHERVPFTRHELHTVYHLRSFDEQRLSLLPPADIFLSHDWPVDITKYGDRESLVRVMPRFKGSIATNSFGAPPLSRLIDAVRPRYWFSAHMHIKFPAVKVHPAETGKPMPPQYEKDPKPEAWLRAHGLDPSRPIRPRPAGHATRFLALSKPLPGKRDWYQILDIPAPSNASPPKLSFDPAWLAICKTVPVPFGRLAPNIPDNPQTRQACQVALLALEANPLALGPIAAVQVFAKTAPGEGDGAPEEHYANPQTKAFCDMIGIEDLTNPAPHVVRGEGDEAREGYVPGGGGRGGRGGRGGGGRGGGGRGGRGGRGRGLLSWRPSGPLAGAVHKVGGEEDTRISKTRQ